MNKFKTLAVWLIIGVSALSKADPVINLDNKGLVFTGTQAITLLGDNEVAVGKWDNTIEIISSVKEQGYFPKLDQTIVIPSKKGVQMLAKLDENSFASSNDATSLVIWKEGKQGEYKRSGYADYSGIQESPGIANSGSIIQHEGRQYFVSGHANGYVIIWLFDGLQLHYVNIVDLRSHNPVPSPYPLKNIRSIASWKNGLFVTGSEDGDITIVNVISGAITYRMRYNLTAQRGINQVQVLDDYLLISNCAVGTDDKNLWLYRLAGNEITYLDSLNLKLDQSKEQVFNFGITMGKKNGKILFFTSTQEGALWYGSVTNDQLKLTGYKLLTPNVGAVLSFDSKESLLYASAYNTHVFQLKD